MLLVRCQHSAALEKLKKLPVFIRNIEISNFDISMCNKLPVLGWSAVFDLSHILDLICEDLSFDLSLTEAAQHSWSNIADLRPRASLNL